MILLGGGEAAQPRASAAAFGSRSVVAVKRCLCCQRVSDYTEAAHRAHDAGALAFMEER